MEIIKLSDCTTIKLSDKALDHLMFIKANECQDQLTKSFKMFQAETLKLETKQKVGK